MDKRDQELLDKQLWELVRNLRLAAQLSDSSSSGQADPLLASLDFAALNSSLNGGCACRKSNPDILVMQPAQDRAAKNVPGPSQWRAIPAHPSPGTNACVPHCNISCTTAVRDEDVVRRRQRHDRRIPCGSNRSAVQHIRFAMGSAATLVDHECPLIEVFG